MSSIEFHISSPILDWIAKTQGTDLNGLAQKIVPNAGKNHEQFLQGVINQSQANKLAKMAGIPFGFLFLDSPPKLSKPTLPDFRTVQDSDPLSLDFDAVLSDTHDKLAWYREYLSGIGCLPERLPFVGKFTTKDSALTIAQDIAETIGFTKNCRQSATTQKYFSHISGLLENSGILVFKNGVVGNSTARTLNVREFRGFAIADPQIPAVFINSSDAQTAQLFTLLHETAHIWLGESGVSNPDPGSHGTVERLCNQAAAEFLVPTDEFTNIWDSSNSQSDNLTHTAKVFHVSTYVVAIKAVQQNLMDYQEWQRIRQKDLEHARKRKSSGGGDFYKVLPVRNSKTFTEAVIRATASKQILLREGASLLNIKPPTLMALNKQSTGNT